MNLLFILLAIFSITILYMYCREPFDPRSGMIADNKVFEPGKEYTLTLGNWGKEEPDFCFQTLPEDDALNFQNKHKTCNACQLACSSKKAWDRCQMCLKQL